MLIILRVIRGHAWSRKTARPVITTVRFTPAIPSSTEGTGTQYMVGMNDISELGFKHHSESDINKEGDVSVTEV